MTRMVHRLYLSFYVIVVLISLVALGYMGFSFYKLPIEERFFHPDYAVFKPSGFLGHGLGIVGSLIIVIGVFSYMVRKRMKFLSRYGLLKYWLEFHIFLCSLGPVFILYHTSFKFGGIVSVSFWSLVAVVISGIAGRFIYLQIPHSIEGRELSLREVQDLIIELGAELRVKYNIDVAEFQIISNSGIKSGLRSKHLSLQENKMVRRLIISRNKLVRQIERLDRMQHIFKYWHVAHLPFALIMLIVMIIHIIVVIALGYKWIF
jgi:hypothetical protein